MSQFPSQQQRARPFELGYGTDDRSVFNFFNTVYAWMAVGIALTAVVGYYVSITPALMNVFLGSRGVYLAFFLGAFAISWYAQSQVGRLSVPVATTLFLLYAALMGALTSFIFHLYTPKTLLAAFLLTGGTFGAMSLYGFITKRDLSRIGSILAMCAIGLLIASLVNVFLANDAFSWVITYGVLIVFIGITAWQTQLLRNMAIQLAHDPAIASRVAVIGSLILYISFMNIFMAILRILGDRR